mgnify:CR=1 FL=1
MQGPGLARAPNVLSRPRKRARVPGQPASSCRGLFAPAQQLHATCSSAGQLRCWELAGRLCGSTRGDTCCFETPAACWLLLGKPQAVHRQQPGTPRTGWHAAFAGTAARAPLRPVRAASGLLQQRAMCTVLSGLAKEALCSTRRCQMHTGQVDASEHTAYALVPGAAGRASTRSAQAMPSGCRSAHNRQIVRHSRALQSI